MADYKTDDTWLMQGDCLERMKEIPDGSIDLILTDPPLQRNYRILKMCFCGPMGAGVTEKR